MDHIKFSPEVRSRIVDSLQKRLALILFLLVVLVPVSTVKRADCPQAFSGPMGYHHQNADTRSALMDRGF